MICRLHFSQSFGDICPFYICFEPLSASRVSVTPSTSSLISIYLILGASESCKLELFLFFLTNYLVPVHAISIHLLFVNNFQIYISNSSLYRNLQFVATSIMHKSLKFSIFSVPIIIHCLPTPECLPPNHFID